MRLRFTLQKTTAWMASLPVGGKWGYTLAAAVQKNLRWFWFDSLFASAYDNIIANYLSLFVLSLGAVEYQIGLMSSLANFSSALLLLVGAVLAVGVALLVDWLGALLERYLGPRGLS